MTALLFAGLALPVCAQNAPLQLGSVTAYVPASPCPPGPIGTLPLPGALCYTATVDNCSDSLGEIPALNATVAVSTPKRWNSSTIFLHDGNTGQDYFNAGSSGLSYAQDYFNNGFQVVQLAWADDWHDNTNNPAVKSLKYEACRPATLLNYVYTHVHGGSTSGAMCAQGHSAGSAAIAFALAWYGASSYLNSVVLTSGPVYSNVEAGCQYPYAEQYESPIQVCPSKPAQFGCVDGSLGGWTDSVQYLNTPSGGTAKGVAQSTNGPPPGNCNNYTGSRQSTTSFDQNWSDMSIVSSGASYSYPQTSLYAFLCATGQSQNNSAAQGQLFYQNFTSSSQALNYSVYRVDGCGGSESIWDGTTANGSAFTVSANDMMNACTK